MANRIAVAVAGGAAALLSLGLVAGCARPGSGNGAEAGGSMTPSPGTSASASGPPSNAAGPTPSPLPPVQGPKPSLPAAGPDQTIGGTVRAGVGPGCLLLTDAGKDYLLMSGDPRYVFAGAEVVLTGHVVTGIMTYCMQGTPFEVTKVHVGEKPH